MKKLFAVYAIIGLICVPFIYFNNAEGYKPASGKMHQWGRALGQALYWPSYVFSIEPEVDSESVNSFQKSIIEIVAYRNDKLFTGKRSGHHEHMVLTALGNCLALEGADKNSILNLYQELFEGNTEGKEVERIRSAIMEKMDGYDFADIVEAGEECGENLDYTIVSTTVSAIAERATSEFDRNNTRPSNNAPTPVFNETLTPSVKSEPNKQSEKVAIQRATVSEPVVPYPTPRLSFEKVDLLGAMKRAGMEQNWITHFTNYLSEPIGFWSDCVASEEISAQVLGGMSKEDAKAHGESICKSITQQHYDCLDGKVLDDAVICLQASINDVAENGD